MKGSRAQCAIGFAALTVGISLPSSALAQDVIPTSDGSNTAVLGTAYDSSTEKLLPGSCVTGQPATAGAARSSFSLDQTLSETQLAKELGFSIGGRARYGVVEGSAEANFLSRSTSGGFSIVLIYKANYVFPVSKVLGPVKSTLGSNVDANDEHWQTSCGDRFVHEIRRGASLYVSIRIDFASQSKKDEFSASFNISGPLASANGAMKTASASFDRRTTVTVSALQVGGDVSKLTAVLGGSTDGIQIYTQCSLGNFDSCSQFVGNVLKYASDVTTGFPSQLTPTSQPGPADLSYSTASYESIGIYRHISPQAIRGLALARADLSRQFEANLAAANAVRRLRDAPMANSRRLKLQAIGSTADNNISTILPVAQTCYDSPADCRAAVTSLQLVPIASESLLPPTFLSYCRDSIGFRYNPGGGPNDLQAMSVSYIIGATSNNPSSGAFVTEKACVDADARLTQTPFITVSQQVNLWHLAGYDNIREITMKGASGRLRDITPLSMFPDLSDVEMTDLDIESLSPLLDSSRLISVDFTKNNINSLQALANKPRLISVILAENRITDLTPLASDTQLFQLDVRSNPIHDLTPLHGLTGLTFIDLRNVPITPDQIRSLAAAVPKLSFAIGPSFGPSTSHGTADEFIASWP